MDEMERIFREAVRDAVAESHAAGIPVFQVIDDYLVAVYPDGRTAKLKKIEGGSTRDGPGNATAQHDNSGRPERGRKVNTR